MSWHHNCHVASLQVVRSGLYPNSRVARGRAVGVSSQHSWVVVGSPYRPEQIIDPSIWSYVKGAPVEVPREYFYKYVPHGGAGSIWDSGRPYRAAESGEPVVELTPKEPLSDEALNFLSLCGPPRPSGLGGAGNESGDRVAGGGDHRGDG